MNHRHDIHDPRFDPYFGNHHRIVEPPESRWGGFVNLFQYVGKPLSPALWHDLVGRMAVRRILIYRPGEPQWTYGWPQGTIIVHVDEKNLFKNAYFIPYGPPTSCPVCVNQDPPTYAGGEIIGFTNHPNRSSEIDDE